VSPSGEHAPIAQLGRYLVNKVIGSWGSDPRSSPFCPGLDDDATFGSKSFLRSRLVRSLRGSTSSSTERSTAPVPRDVTRQDSGQSPTGRVNDTEGLTTVVEEDLEDWVDDFEAICLSDVPLGVAKPNPSLAHLAPPTRPRLPSPTRPIPPNERNGLSHSDRVRLARHRDDPASRHVGKQSSDSSLTSHSRQHLSPILHRAFSIIFATHESSSFRTTPATPSTASLPQPLLTAVIP
jgi:hypothetical protein